MYILTCVLPLCDEQRTEVGSPVRAELHWDEVPLQLKASSCSCSVVSVPWAHGVCQQCSELECKWGENRVLLCVHHRISAFEFGRWVNLSWSRSWTLALSKCHTRSFGVDFAQVDPTEKTHLSSCSQIGFDFTFLLSFSPLQKELCKCSDHYNPTGSSSGQGSPIWARRNISYWKHLQCYQNWYGISFVSCDWPYSNTCLLLRMLLLFTSPAVRHFTYGYIYNPLYSSPDITDKAVQVDSRT